MARPTTDGTTGHGAAVPGVALRARLELAAG